MSGQTVDGSALHRDRVSRIFFPYRYYLALAALFAFCGIHGYELIRGLPYPPYQDSLRDLGFVQGILDGNFFKDPVNAGAWRWYPPLIHFIAAGIVKVTGADPMNLWMRAAPWLNLLTPATFFLLGRRLVGLPAATFATFAFMLLNGLLIPPYSTATYAPWPYTPIIAQIFFYLSVFLIAARSETGRLLDAAAIGAAVGLTYLAHAVPGLILIPIVPTAAFVTQGFRLRTLVWLAVAGTIAAILALLFMAPLIIAYHLRVLNELTVQVDPGLFTPGHEGLYFLVHLPVLLAFLCLFVLRGPPFLERKVVAILAAWMIASGLPLGRLYLCWPVPNGHRVCDAFAMPIHHFHVYLQAAEAIVIGYAGQRLYRYGVDHRGAAVQWLARGVLLILVCAGAVMFLRRPSDDEMIARVTTAKLFDLGLYRWAVAQTQPTDLFVTDLPDYFAAPAAQAIFSAGRRLVAVHRINSDPYLDWNERNRRRLAYYRAALGTSPSPPEDLCRLLAEAGPSASAYVVLPKGLEASNLLGPPIFQSATNTVFRVERSRLTDPPCPIIEKR